MGRSESEEVEIVKHLEHKGSDKAGKGGEMRLHLQTTSPRKHSADGCEVRREPRPLKEERKCLGVAEPEKLDKVGRGAACGGAGRAAGRSRGAPRGSVSS